MVLSVFRRRIFFSSGGVRLYRYLPRRPSFQLEKGSTPKGLRYFFQCHHRGQGSRLTTRPNDSGTIHTTTAGQRVFRSIQRRHHGLVFRTANYSVLFYTVRQSFTSIHHVSIQAGTALRRVGQGGPIITTSIHDSVTFQSRYQGHLRSFQWFCFRLDPSGPLAYNYN